MYFSIGGGKILVYLGLSSITLCELHQKFIAVYWELRQSGFPIAVL